VATSWAFPPDPELEPVTEVVSVHGASEAPDAPAVIYNPAAGSFVRDALDRGYRLGFVGSGDGHDGHPGLAWRGPHYPTGGLAAVLTEDLTHAGVLAALRARRVYATSGPRILLRFALGTARMGESVAAGELAGEPSLFVQAIASGPLDRVELVLKGDEVLSLPCNGELDFAASATLGSLVSGDWIYARVIQLDGGMAWSSPVFVE
jgi:hypothetical protein